MYRQGVSLGRQLRPFMAPLHEWLAYGEQESFRVWFLGRDMDAFYCALRSSPAARYVAGLNRWNAGELFESGRLARWLRSIGVRDGDVLVDSGYQGSIFALIEQTDLRTRNLLLTTDKDYYIMDPCLNTRSLRHAVLALEHSPKREVVSWDSGRKVPHVVRCGGKEGQRAHAFLGGCVCGLLGEENLR